MRNVLDHISVDEYRFRDLDWRLEGRVASRCLLNQSIPFITIKFHLDCENVNEKKFPLENALETTTNTTKNGIDAKQSRRRQVIFQTDPNNLLYIINVLEKTLNEARTHRARNIVKNL